MCIVSSVTSIGNGAFSDCSGLESITVASGNTKYHSSGNCLIETATKTLIVGSNNSVIPSDGSVTSIDSWAFYGCSGLTSITIPGSVTSIGSGAFEYCSGLTSITIPDSVTSIGSGAFEYCSGLTSITIPDSVTSIENYAFAGCSVLTSITIPASVTSIGERAFYNCDNLENIYITDVAAWLNISGLYDLMDYGSSNKKLYLNNELVTNLVIPDGVTSIAGSAFRGCSGLTSVTIPASVTSIGYAAFYNCSGLESITVASNNTKYYSKDNCLIETATKKLILGCKNSVIPIDGTVTSIGSYAFYGCDGLTNVTIPDSVTSIGYEAFECCSGLTSVTIPASVTSIGYAAFYNCSGLESITVASNNTKYYSKDNCLIETATKKLILGCKNSVIPIDGTVTSIGNSAFSWCSGLTSITIPDSVTSIGEDAFSGCDGLTSVTIPDSVTSIGESAFYCCNGLESITVASGNAKYHSSGNCLIETATKTLIVGCNNSVIPSDGSVTSIDHHALYYCSGLIGELVIPNSFTSIGALAFSNCSGITSITIGNGVTSIGDMAFEGCSELTSVTIGNGVTSICFGAFSGCSGLNEIKFNGTVAEWNAITKGEDWNKNVPATQVICSDGTVDL